MGDGESGALSHQSARDRLDRLGAPPSPPRGVYWWPVFATGPVGAMLPFLLHPVYLWLPADLVMGFAVGYGTVRLRWRRYRRRRDEWYAQRAARLLDGEIHVW